jgi:hypothetical protein
MKPLNKREAKVYEEYKKEGWEVFHKGWPDFLVYKSGNLRMIEVKREQKRPSKKMGLSKHQRRMKEILERFVDYRVIYIK